MKLCHHLLMSGVCLCCLAVPQATLAQSIRGDGSTFTNVASDCNIQCNVTGGIRRGRNLFHSFEEFNIGEDQHVQFAAPHGVKNILSRITGNNPSHIQGILGVNGQANLFLLNPNGIIFGPNAQLDLRGSFVATTANNFVFSDGSKFSAVHPQAPPLLAISVPVGLQFGQTAGRIQSQGDLQVDSKRTLALIGRDLTLSGGSLIAGACGGAGDGCATLEGGQIELGSIGQGQVNLVSNPNGFAFGYGEAQSFQDIQASEETVVSTAGKIGGAIHLEGRNITLSGNSNISSGTLSQTADTGEGEDLIVNASGFLRLRDGSRIGTFTDGQDDAGDVRLQSSNSIRLTNSVLGLDPDSSNLTLHLTSIFSEVCLISPSCETVTGNGGNLFVNTRRLQIQNARIEASTFGRGRGGNIQVTAPDVLLHGEIPFPTEQNRIIYQSSGIYTQVAKGAIPDAGDAGNLVINAERLVARAGGQISSATFSGGDGGIVTVNASNIFLRSSILNQTDRDVGNSGIFASSEPNATGNAGEININADQLILADRAEISIRNLGGQAGSLRISANSVDLDQARFTAKNAAGDGGNIILRSFNQLSMRRGSQITAEALNNANGGNVIITADTVTAAPNQNNDILANANRGNGGNIFIFTHQPISGLKERRSQPDNKTNDIDASSQFGQAGTVALSLPVNTEVQPLTLANAEPIQGCQVEGRRTSASFFDTGRGGIPPTPYEPLSSDEILEDVRLPIQETGNLDPSDQGVTEAKAWVVNEQGQVVLVAPAQFQGCQLR